MPNSSFRRFTLVVGSASIIVAAFVLLRWSPSSEEVSDPMVDGLRGSTVSDEPDQQYDSPLLASSYDIDNTPFIGFESAEIKWRDREPRVHPTRPYGALYGELRQKALDGDATAAFDLYYILDECKNAFGSEDELSVAIDQFRQTQTIQFPSWEKPLRLRNAEALEGMIKDAKKSLDDCYPITQDQKTAKESWLEMASINGSVAGNIWLATSTDDPNKSLTSAEVAWQAGAMEALPVLYERYSELYEQGIDTQGKKKAIASLYAYAFLITSSRNSTSDPQVRDALARLADTKANTLPHEFSEAADIAVSLINENSRCCLKY